MNKLDFEAINLALDASVVVPMWLPDGQRRGGEWIARNPTRDDRNPGSFSINLARGHWKDFATSDAGSDLVSLYAYLFHNSDQGAAARELAETNGVRIGDPVVREHAARVIAERIPDVRPEIILPVPADAAEPTFEHFRYGKPVATWTYRDTDGRVLLYVCRFEPPGERKQIVPRSWCTNPKKNDKPEWMWRGITGNAKRPLYGLDRLAAAPEADVLVVEGEKTADAASKLLGDAAVCMAWLGGVETADRVDVRRLKGRRVILWPDFDAQTKRDSDELLPLHEQPGMRAMLTIAQSLKGVAREVVVLPYELRRDRHGWDLADALQDGWTASDVLKYINSHTTKPASATTGHELVPLGVEVNQFGFPHINNKGLPLNTVENLDYLLSQYGITVRYNIMRKLVEVRIPGRDYGDDLHSNCTIAEIGSICARNRLPKSDAEDYIKLISSRNQYNPVEQFIRSKAWDGVSRFDQLLNTLTMTPGFNRELAALLLRRWLISAAAAALKGRGFWSKGVLVLQGGQSAFKTSWFKSLVPTELRELLKVGATIDPANKDSVASVISHWLVEMGELDATFKKADQARLKSFISQDRDQLRRPYDRLESDYQRRSVFFASVNPKTYLLDDTGNARWWTISVVSVNAAHDIDMQQLWAEAAHYFDHGERWWLEKEEEALLESSNDDHQTPNPIEELIRERFDWSKTPMLNMSATAVLHAIGYEKATNPQAKEAGTALRKVTGKEPHKSNGSYVWKMPPMHRQQGRGQHFEHDDEARPF